MPRKSSPSSVSAGDHVLVTWVDHVEYEDVPLAHDSFRLIVFKTFGRLDYFDDHKLHLTTTVQDSEDSAKNTVLVIGRGMVTKIETYKSSGEASLP